MHNVCTCPPSRFSVKLLYAAFRDKSLAPYPLVFLFFYLFREIKQHLMHLVARSGTPQAKNHRVSTWDNASLSATKYSEQSLQNKTKKARPRFFIFQKEHVRKNTIFNHELQDPPRKKKHHEPTEQPGFAAAGAAAADSNAEYSSPPSAAVVAPDCSLLLRGAMAGRLYGLINLSEMPQNTAILL